MKRIIRYVLCVTVFAAFLFSQTQNQRRHKLLMSDPLFGIQYDTQEVHFENMPSSLIKRCPDLRSRYIEAWLYARVKAADSEYLIISGLMKSDANVDEPGVVVAINSGEANCDERAADGLFWGKQATNAPDIADSDLKALAADAIHRYTRAFGGKDRFLKRLSPTMRRDVGPTMQRELDTFQNQPRS